MLTQLLTTTTTHKFPSLLALAGQVGQADKARGGDEVANTHTDPLKVELGYQLFAHGIVSHGSQGRRKERHQNKGESWEGNL